MKVLQEVSVGLKRLVADLSLDKAILQDINLRTIARPALKRHAMNHVVGHYGTSRRRACRLVCQHRSVHFYRTRRDPRTALRTPLRERAQVRFATGIAACRCYCRARAGRRVRTRSIGCTPRKACN